MARTYRRKSRPVPTWVTHRNVRISQCYYYVKVPLEGKDLSKAIAKWHADKEDWGFRPQKWFRRNDEKIFRAKNRTELCRYWKDPDYEVMILSKNKLPFWD